MPRFAFGGAGEVLECEVQKQIGPDIVQRRSAEHREHAALANGLAQAVVNMFHGQGAGVEELFQVGVVAFGHHFDQRFVRGLGGFGEVRGNLAFFSLAVAVGRVGVGLHLHQIHHALKVFLGADGQVNRNGGAAKEGLHAFEGALEAGALAVQFVDDDGARKLKFFAEGPNLLGLHFDAGHAVHQDEGRIGRRERGLGVIDKNVEAGRVQQVDLFLIPLGCRDGGGNRDLARDLFVVEIGDGGAFVDAREAAGGARCVQQSRG